AVKRGGSPNGRIVASIEPGHRAAQRSRQGFAHERRALQTGTSHRPGERSRRLERPRCIRMLFLLFQLGTDRYALEASRVVEVVPLLEMKRLPSAPKGVAGLFNYRGHPVPAVDLRELSLGEPARERMSTPIIVVKCPGADGAEQLLGLIAEQATE